MYFKDLVVAHKNSDQFLYYLQGRRITRFPSE